MEQCCDMRRTHTPANGLKAMRHIPQWCGRISWHVPEIHALDYSEKEIGYENEPSPPVQLPSVLNHLVRSQAATNSASKALLLLLIADN